MSDTYKIDWGTVFAESFIEVYENKIAKTVRFIFVVSALLLAIISVGWLAVNTFKAIFMSMGLEILIKPVVILVVGEVLFPVIYLGTLVSAVLVVGIRKGYLLYKEHIKPVEAPKEEVKAEENKSEETPKEEVKSEEAQTGEAK